MASNLGRYTISDPATSKDFQRVVQESIDSGTRRFRIEMKSVDTAEAARSAEFSFDMARFYDMSAEYIGKLDDQGIATVLVNTHPDFSDAPAQLTLTRRATP